ncbi:ATP synthase mitochondrial F1 complex assembly factor 1 [Extremus antarcticus]|uniref:ATP synthase mitochondrial F1 complex assembly factor 1 n=1 Tax=Extremus antarcticus TaxID=702011 RepID=A0AAJ0DAV6_9PEZI|nr:ATP synthase mitochondrial F1 complex assembly factor 1 [Extremus antarcticus]
MMRLKNCRSWFLRTLQISAEQHPRRRSICFYPQTFVRQLMKDDRQDEAALGQKATIAFEAGDGSLSLASDGASPQIILDAADWLGVIRAAQDLAADFGRVTGSNGTVMLMNGTDTGPPSYSSGSTSAIIVGTIGNSSLIDSLVKSGKISVGKTEGADKRGSIYGIYDVSEQIGVSPWYFYADVPAKQHSAIYALNTRKH